ncbi:MAG: prolyl oligopeptidase family serine peptidase [Prevotellaceae bacterium]|jgi:dipeptidyl aminopeptidase/acylaminoacyl peptidase|nr:prolyl oligopeptidase family serine peptidase [Prevotellaceae bacterium]
MKKYISLLLISIAIIACSTGASDSVATSIPFQGRTVDLKPFLEFPYSQFSVSKDGTKLFFFKTGDENKLQWVDIGKNMDLNKAQDAVNLNFATRNCWSPTYNEKDGFLYWIGDQANDEIINIYRAKLGSDTVEKLTDVPYIYAWSFNPERTKIAYVARLAQNENRLDELRILDLATLNDVSLCYDSPLFRFTWGNISWHPKEKGLALVALKEADRTFTNIVYVDLASKEIIPLTDSNKKASLRGSSVPEKWASDEEFFFLSDQNGYTNIYRYSLTDRKSEQITDYRMDIDELSYVEIEGRKYILFIQNNPVETTLALLDPATKEVKYRQSSELSLQTGAVVGDKLILTAGATNQIFQLIEGKVSLDTLALQIAFDLPEELKQKLVYSTVERLEIPTFDLDPLTGKQRILHAWLYSPLDPPSEEKRMVMIESFYGGANHYSEEYQILCQAGIYVLSPAPRGSSGFGRDFEAMNDKDLGGNEILDIIYAAQYIDTKLNIPAKRTGVFGMSHGGYATMRLMTFPGEVNGHNALFPFGFGIEVAGFCDIIWQHRHSNIPDWTALEAGDPAVDSLKLLDRSPITHADKITGALLLIHGDHDNRVDIAGSRMMADKLKELGKTYRFVEFPGMGHGIKGSENKIKYHTECLNFLDF